MNTDRHARKLIGGSVAYDLPRQAAQEFAVKLRKRKRAKAVAAPQ